MEGIDIFIRTFEDLENPITTTELAVLEQFVQQGGAVIEFTPGPRENSFLGTTLRIGDFRRTGSEFLPGTETHPIRTGAFGPVADIVISEGPVFDAVGQGVELARRLNDQITNNGADLGPFLLDIPIGTANARGLAILAAEDEVFATSVPGGRPLFSMNRTLWLNTIQYLATAPGFRADSDESSPADVVESFSAPDGDYSELQRLTDRTFRHVSRLGVVREYNEEGFQTALIDRNGNTTSYAYDSAGLLTTITDPVGLVTTFSYSGDKLASVTDPAGRTTNFAVDGNGDLTSITYPDGSTKQFEQDTNHLMIKETNERGFETTREYDDFGRFRQSALPDGAVRVALASQTVGAIRSSSANSSGGAGSSFGSSDNPAPVVRPDAAVSSFTDGEGRTTTTTTDNLGRPLRTVDPLNRITSVDRDVEGNPVRSEQPNGLVFTRVYDGAGNVVQLRNEATGASVSATFDSNNLITSFVDELGGTASWERDDHGNVISTRNRAGHTTLSSFDSSGRITEVSMPNGLLVSTSYNAQGLLDRLTADPGAGGSARVSIFEYDAAGNLTRSVSPTGLDTEFSYDNRGRLVASADNLGRGQAWQYNGNSDVVSAVVRENGSNISESFFSYDPLDRLETLSRPHLDGNATDSLSYDLVGNIIAVEDAVNEEGSREVDDGDRLRSVVDSLGGSTNLTYDASDNLVSFVDANGVRTEFEYDLSNRLISESSPDRGTRTHTYDVRNRLVSTTDSRGITITNTYDSLDRLLSSSYPDANENVRFGYDDCVGGVGRLCSRNDESGSAAWEYDVFGNIRTDTRVVAGETYSVGYSYDANNRVITQILPSGRNITITRDVASRITRIDSTVNGVVTPIVANVTYRADNFPTLIEMGNGLVENRSFDNQGRMTSWNVESLASRDVTYSADDNVLGISGNPFSATYAYDGLDRLTQESGASGDRTYSYDSNGNRTSQTDGFGATDYGYQPGTNRLISVNGVNQQRDSVGNLTSNDEGSSFTYNNANRLVGLTTPSGAASYLHNGEGQRVAKTIDGVTTIFIYGTAGEIIAEAESTGAITREYIYLNSVPVAQIDIVGNEEIVTILHTDHLGSPRYGTAADGELVWTWFGDAFGTSVPNSDADGDGVHTEINLRFPGQYFDVESGLHYNVFRDYIPARGRYAQADPTGLLGGVNLYGYALQNPNSFIDPTGEVPVFVVTGLVGGVVGAFAGARDGGGFTGAVTGFLGGAATGVFGGAGAGTVSFAGGVFRALGTRVSTRLRVTIPASLAGSALSGFLGLNDALAQEIGVPVEGLERNCTD